MCRWAINAPSAPADIGRLADAPACGTEGEFDLSAAADAVLADPATVWEECGTWVLDGTAVMDSAEAGSDLGIEYPDAGMPAEASVPLPAGR
ncbi:Imm21 family immunity protein [Streptomyces sp. NPDC058579]|uniref:Imm21 family immunity protein n=1 Tax=Streptomyces sp. NPDC058579 TaxID=3346548 RepID=UPI0036544B6F